MVPRTMCGGVERLAPISAVVLLLAVSGCDSLGATCGGWGHSVSPRDTTISVGSDFRATIEVVGCPADGVPEPDDFRWSTNRPDVATVDLRSGEVRAVGPGAATVTATAPQPHSPVLDVEVTVTGAR